MSLVHHPHARALSVAVVVTILWASSWVLIRIGLDDDDLAPLSFAGIRYGVAALTLTAWIAASAHRRSQLRRLDGLLWRRLVVLGVVFIAITQGAQFVAIDNQPAATTSLTLAPTALLVALLSGHLIGERPTRRQIVGAALIAVGAATYFAGDLGATWIGMTAALVGLGANVTSALLGRSINRAATTSPVVITAVSMAIGASLLVAAGFAIEGWPNLTGRLVLIIAWLGIVNTAFAFTLWNWSQRHLAAVESAAVNNTMLVQIALLAWLFLGEFPGPIAGLGILVVTSGTYLSTILRGGPSRADVDRGHSGSRDARRGGRLGRRRSREEGSGTAGTGTLVSAMTQEAPAAPAARVRIDDEYGPLARVAVCPASSVPDARSYDRSDPEFSKYVSGGWDAELLRQQQIRFIAAMREAGVDVVHLTPRPQLPWQMYTRDTAFVVGDTLFFCGTRGLTDRNEEIHALLESEAVDHDTRIVELTEGTIEGGDVLVDADVVLVGSSSRTTPSAAHELARHLDRPVRILELGDQVMHLDTRLTILGRDLALVAPWAFTERDLGFLAERYDLIEVTRDESEELATNVFVLDPSTVVVHDGHERIARLLEARGWSVVRVAYSEPIALSGSFRCSTMPLLRH